MNAPVMSPVEASHFATLSGACIDLNNIQPSLIHLNDILYGLIHTPRFNGQTSRPYSVAHHTLAMYEAFEAREPVDPIRPIVGRETLIHDVPEYITGDIVTGVKARFLDAYRQLETEIDQAVRVKFKIEPVPPKIAELVRARVKALDFAAYVSEALILQCRRVAPIDRFMHAATLKAVSYSDAHVHAELTRLFRTHVINR